jgi:hypothetical protein
VLSVARIRWRAGIADERLDHQCSLFGDVFHRCVVGENLWERICVYLLWNRT